MYLCEYIILDSFTSEKLLFILSSMCILIFILTVDAKLSLSTSYLRLP